MCEKVIKLENEQYEIKGQVWPKVWTEDEDFLDPIIEILDNYKGKRVKVIFKVEELEVE